MNKLKKILIKFLPFSKWRKIIRKCEQEQEILYNVFNKNYKKRVLVSYIKEPFMKDMHKEHTNVMECKTACEIFDELGYQVDVVEYSQILSTSELKKYDIVYGFGKSFNVACSNPDIITIFYGTGCSTIYANKKTIKKVIDFYNKTKSWCFSSSRYLDTDIEIVLSYAKALIILGNDFVKNTYLEKNKRDNVFNLNAFYYDINTSDIYKKNYQEIKNNFLYFGSTGALHKGLDVLIELFKRRSDLNLTICGFNKDNEKEFYEYYKNVFEGECPNIKYYPFVNIESDLYKTILKDSIAVITPSLSEGGAVATLMCMANGGLIPVISKSTGLDVEDLGFVFDEISEENIEKIIDKLLLFENDVLLEMTKNIQNKIKQEYSYNLYKVRLKNIISNIIKTNE